MPLRDGFFSTATQTSCCNRIQRSNRVRLLVVSTHDFPDISHGNICVTAGENGKAAQASSTLPRNSRDNDHGRYSQVGDRFSSFHIYASRGLASTKKMFSIVCLLKKSIKTLNTDVTIQRANVSFGDDVGEK